jgi:hypothetical protein
MTNIIQTQTNLKLQIKQEEVKGGNEKNDRI